MKKTVFVIWCLLLLSARADADMWNYHKPVDMNNNAVYNSTTIPYSPSSSTLVTAEYVENVKADCFMMAGISTRSTTSKNYVHLDSGTVISPQGVGLQEIKVLLNIKATLSNSVASFLLQATTSTWAESHIEQEQQFNLDEADTLYYFSFHIIKGYGKCITAGIPIHFRMQWKTSKGEIINETVYRKAQRNLTIIRYPNAQKVISDN